MNKVSAFQSRSSSTRAGLRVSVELGNRLIALRRDLHQHPELSFGETRSASVLRDFLTALGITDIMRVAVRHLLRGRDT